MRHKLCLVSGLVILTSALIFLPQRTANHLITTNTLQKHVTYLSSQKLQGRLTGSQGEKSATLYAANFFQASGLEPAGDDHTYFQYFDFTTSTRSAPHSKIKAHSRNVLARLNLGKDTAPVILISAHADHLGYGELGGSREAESTRIHYGADDNASGVASVLEAAARLSSMHKQNKLHGNYNIIFAIWSGEEIGLLGSSHFIANKSPRLKLAANINLDMVGRLRKQLMIQGAGSSNSWKKMIASANQANKLSIQIQNDPYLPTDSISFYLHQVPSINLFTGAHDEYHTSRDTAETINYTGLQNITDFLVSLTQALESEKTPITYQSVTKKMDHANRRFKVYLGTIPDYASSDMTGVKLSGVSSGSPAQLAGLKPNDVIVALAGKKVRDIYDYTDALNALHAGVPVSLVVQRDHVRMKLKITALSRE